MGEADIGIVGLAVMGQNLTLNLESSGFSAAVYNRTAERTETFIERRAAQKRIHPTYDYAGFVDALARPRKILLMVKAGPATDAVLSDLLPHLEPGDLVMDGGNAHVQDTNRRFEKANGHGISYLGVGISGGEWGALHGPSLMVGGSPEAYSRVAGILEKIAARGPKGPCCALLGPGSAGHYVKMIHNGIEYAMMQCLSEAYDLMTRGLSLSAPRVGEIFGEWVNSELGGYLVEITADILSVADPQDGQPLVDKIQDVASQKGTGKWSSQSALDLGSPAPTVAASVFARFLSARKPERLIAGRSLSGPNPLLAGDPRRTLTDLHSALLLGFAASYAQGFRQMLDGSEAAGYGLDLSEVARIWMGGCIIRSQLLLPVYHAYRSAPDLGFLFFDEAFRRLWSEHQEGLRNTVIRSRSRGIPIAGLGSALDFVDTYRTPRLPANLIQAQRDYFGAHTYQRTDREGTFHTEWTSVRSQGQDASIDDDGGG